MARQTTDHYEEEIGPPYRSVYRHIDSESSFTEPGADTPGPPHQPSAFVPVTYQHHSENTNSMVVVVPIARQSNHESSSQEREQRREAFGSVQHGNRHRDTPLNDDERRLMPPPQPVDPRPGELPNGADFGRASTMTASTIDSIGREIRSPMDPIQNIPMAPRSPIVPATSIGLTEPHTEVRYAPPPQPPRSVRRQFGDQGLSDSTQHHRTPIAHSRVEEYTDRVTEFRLPERRPNPLPRSSFSASTGEHMEVDRPPIRRPAQVLQPTRPRADHRQVEPALPGFNPTPSIHHTTTPATSLPTPAASASLHANGTQPLTRPIHSNPAYSHNPQASNLQYSPNQTGSRAPTLSSNLPSTPQQNQAALAQPSHIQSSRETNDQLATPTVLPANTRPRRQEPLYQESNLSQVQPPPMQRPVQQTLQMTANSNAQLSNHTNNNSYQTQSGHASSVHLSSQHVNVPGPTAYTEPAQHQFIPTAPSFLQSHQTHGPMLAASTTTIPSRNVQLSGSLNYQPRITQPAIQSQIIRSGPVVQSLGSIHAHNQHHNNYSTLGHFSPVDADPLGHSSRIPTHDYHHRRPHHSAQHQRPISPYNRRNHDDYRHRSTSPHENYTSRNSRRALDFSYNYDQHYDRRGERRRDHSPYDRDERDNYSRSPMPRQSRSPIRRDRRDRDEDSARRRIDSYDEESPQRSSSRENRQQTNPRDRHNSEPSLTRMEPNAMNQLVPQTNNPGHLDDPRLNPRAQQPQEYQTNNQLIQLSSISNTIGLGNLQNSLNSMIVPMIKDQGIQQGHREMSQNFQMQMELKELRSQKELQAANSHSQLVEMLENKFKELTKSLPEKIREASGERERRNSERWPDLVKTPESNSASSQYSDVEQSPYRKPRQRNHHPYRRPHRSGDFDSPQGSPAESYSNRRLHRNISGNSGGFSSAQSSPIDSVMDDSNFHANSLSPTQYSDLTTEEVCSKLQEWHMPDDIIENFRREKINGRHLNYLNEFMIRTGCMTQEVENENLRQIRPLAERLGPRKTLWRALRMHVSQKSLPLNPSDRLQPSKDCWRRMDTPMGDVGLWLRTIQLGEFTRNFADEQVEGCAVYDINEPDLIHLGLDKLGDRLTFVIERDMMT